MENLVSIEIATTAVIADALTTTWFCVDNTYTHGVNKQKV